MDNIRGGLDAVNGVSASTDAQDSSPETTTQAPDPIKNLKAEFNRKVSKVDQKLDQVLNALAQRQVGNPVEETDAQTPDYKRYVDTKFSQAQQEQVKSRHEQDFMEAKQRFPELDELSDSYDPEFFKMVDKFYTKRGADLSDPDALRDAVELAAVRQGKIERLTQDKLLRDEARRSRIISEGGSIPKESKREKEPQLNEQALSKLGIKDMQKFKAFIKQNKDKYGDSI